MKWPDYFPDNCPPDRAREASGEVYRLVDNNPPTPEDFQSWREQHPTEKCPKSVTECQACGLSVFTSMDDVNMARQKVKRLRKKMISVGNLTSELGRILHTPSQNTGESHHIWWLPIGVQAWAVFRVVDVTK